MKLDVSKSHISLILINTFAWCCKWSLFSLLADIKQGIIIATTSWKDGAEKVCISCWSSPYTSIKMDANYFIQWTPREGWSGTLVLLECGGWKWDNFLLSLHHTLRQESKTQVTGYPVPRIPQQECWVGIIPSLLPLSSLLGLNHSTKQHIFWHGHYGQYGTVLQHRINFVKIQCELKSVYEFCCMGLLRCSYQKKNSQTSSLKEIH